MKNFKYLLAGLLLATTTMLGACSNDKQNPEPEKQDESVQPQGGLNQQPGDEELLGGGIAVGPDVVSGQLADAVLAVKDALDLGYLPDTPLYIDQLEEIYGVNPADVKQFIGEVPMISMNPDVFIAIEANEGAVESVEAALNQYRDYLINDSMQYPQNVEKVKTTQVLTFGDYVFLVLLGAPNDDLDATEEDSAKFAQAEAQKAMDALTNFFK